ncbi:MAG: carbohydrate ABC transporter substrate-binding protein [Clostridia bacterium]|nr:carbohydrate ABC transporter substrate-binding protein [Clostridia bacterium]
MFNKIKKIFAILLIAVCFASMAIKAVGGNNAKQITLSFWGTNLPYQFALEGIAAQYNEMQDEYEVVIDKQDAGNYRIWMGGRLAGGNASDLLATTNVYANTDASNGYLYDLSEALNQPNPYSDSGLSWKDDFSGTYLTQVAYANDTSKFYCVPTNTVSVRFMINTDILEQNGIEIPTADWTFSDYRRICEKLENSGYETAMEIANAKFINYTVSWAIDIMMAQLKYDEVLGYDRNQNGQVETEEIVRAFLEGEDPLDMAKDTDFKEVMQFIKLWSRYWGEGFNSRDDTSENFLRQTVPMMFGGSWSVSGIELTLNNENPEADKTNPYKMFNYISLPFPRLEKEVYLDKDTTFTFTNLKEGLPLQELGEPSGCFCIPKSTVEAGKLEGTLDFLRFFTSAQAASYMAEKAYEIPVIKNVEINEKMYDFLPPENSESIRMRFNLLNLSDGVASEYHFKQVQMYLMEGASSISLSTLCRNVQAKYEEVTELIRDDNGWEW